MKIILLEDIRSLGKKGDVVKVSDGYARNALLPQKKAVEANAKNMNDLKLKKKHDARVEKEELEAAQKLAEDLKDKKVVVSVKTGEGGRTFGSVSTKEIAQAAKDQLNVVLDKKKMTLEEPIRALGTYMVPIKLHAQVTAQLKVQVTEK